MSTTPLTLKITETENGWWYAVYEDEGSEPGSLKAASMCVTREDAIEEGGERLASAVKMRDCEHLFVAYGTTGHFLQCERCNKVQPVGGEWT